MVYIFDMSTCFQSSVYYNDDFSVSDTDIPGKKIPSSPNRSRTYDLPVTSPNSLRTTEL